MSQKIAAKKKEGSVKEFVAEAEEIIEGLGRDLIQLEGCTADSSIDPELINRIFRQAHTLKGISGMLNLSRISELSHNLESMLDELRMGKLPLTQSVVDILFEALETLKMLVEKVDMGEGDNIDISSLLVRIEEASLKSVEDKKILTAEDLPIDRNILKTLTEYEHYRLIENVKLGRGLYEINARFTLNNFDRDLGQLTTKISKIGELITTLPTPGATPESEIVFQLLVGSGEGFDSLTSFLGSENISIKEIPYKRSQTDSTQASKKKEVGVKEESLTSLKSLSQTVRVDIHRLDRLLNIVGELVLNKTIINQVGKELKGLQGYTGLALELDKVTRTLERKLNQLQEGVIEVRMVPIGQVFERLTRVVRKVSKESGKEVTLEFAGGETQLDKLMVEDLVDPLMHLLRNAIDHGIESREERAKKGKPEIGKISIRAFQKGNHVVLEVEDDGAGIDVKRVRETALKKGLLEQGGELDKRQIMELLFVPGFSTSSAVSEISGRGVGLDVVKKNVTRLNGMFDIETEIGKGTKFLITLPITLVIIKALIVEVADKTYAIPLSSISESLSIFPSQIKTVKEQEVMQLRDWTLPLLRLEKVFNLSPKKEKEEKLYVVVVGLAERRIGLIVDTILSQQEIVIKSLGNTLSNIAGIAGATELGNRNTVLVLDAGALIEEVTRRRKT